MTGVLRRCVLLGAILLVIVIPSSARPALAGAVGPSPMDVAIRIDTSPDGIPVEVDGATHATPYAFVCLQNSTHTANATNLSVAGDTRYVFTGWTDGVSAISRPFVCDTPRNLTAAYRTEYFVRFRTSPTGLLLVIDGTTWRTPRGVWCRGGSSVSVEALSPQSNLGTQRIFGNWSDWGAIAHAVPCSGPGNYTAEFRTQHLLGVFTNVAGLIVRVDNASYPAPYSGWCDDRTTHTIGVDTEQPGPGGSYRFVVWSDGGASFHGVDCVRPANYTAEFALVTTPPPPSTPTTPVSLALALILVILLVIGFIVAGAVLAVRSRRPPPAAMFLSPPGGPSAGAAGAPAGSPGNCPRCGSPAQGDWTYCSACGAVLRS